MERDTGGSSGHTWKKGTKGRYTKGEPKWVTPRSSSDLPSSSFESINKGTEGRLPNGVRPTLGTDFKYRE